MTKWYEISPLEYPVRLISKFKCVREYNNGNTRSNATYEHVYAGFMYSMLFCYLSLASKAMILGIPIMFFLHVILKEVIMDKKKREAKPKEIQDRDFKAQLIERSTGFVLAIPFIIGTFILW